MQPILVAGYKTTPQVELTETERSILAACLENPQDSKVLLEVAGYSTRTGNFKRSIAKLLQLGLLELTIPDKPTSRLQKYRLTEKEHLNR
jgi:hypothetical protein